MHDGIAIIPTILSDEVQSFFKDCTIDVLDYTSQYRNYVVSRQHVMIEIQHRSNWILTMDVKRDTVEVEEITLEAAFEILLAEVSDISPDHAQILHEMRVIRPAELLSFGHDARNESYPFSYLVSRINNKSSLLLVLSGDDRAWKLHGSWQNEIPWIESIPPGLYILNGVFRIKDPIGCSPTDWVSETVEDIQTVPLSPTQLANIKKGVWIS